MINMTTQREVIEFLTGYSHNHRDFHGEAAKKGLLALSLLTLLLSACGGSNNVTSFQRSDLSALENAGALEGSQDIIDLARMHPEEVRETFRVAASAQQRFGSVTQSGSSLGGTGGQATASYDRAAGELNITLNRAGVKGVVPGDVVIKVDDNSLTSPEITSFDVNRKTIFDAWNGFSRSFIIYDTQDDVQISTTQVVATLEYPEWHEHEYLFAGYWMRENGGGRSTSTFGGGNEFTSAEVGVFVDAFGINSGVSVPVSGVARYEGTAHGITYSHLDESLLSISTGVWSREMELTADFDSSRPTISGCIGCATDHFGKAVLYESDGVRFLLSEANIKPEDGTFAIQGNGVRMEWDGRTISSTSGSWGGQFYDEASWQSGQSFPEAAVGTFGVNWSDGQDEGVGGSVLGYWYAEHDFSGKYDE